MSESETRVDHFGIAIPQDLAILQDVPLREYLESTEELGYDGLWVSEADASQTLDPLSTLNFAAAITSIPALGAAVLMAARRNPMQLARELASLDQLSAGRLIAGVGLGKSGRNYNYGLSTTNRVGRFEANVRLMKQLWTDNRVSASSEWWELDDVERPLTTVQLPHPPLWFGARSRVALRRAVALGSGWVGAGSSSVAEFEESLREVKRALAELGDDRSDFAIAKRVYIFVGDSKPSVQSEIEQWFARHYGDAGMATRVAIVGTADTCIEHLRGLQSLGVTKLILHPVLQPVDQMERLAHDVIPALRL